MHLYAGKTPEHGFSTTTNAEQKRKKRASQAAARAQQEQRDAKIQAHLNLLKPIAEAWTAAFDAQATITAATGLATLSEPHATLAALLESTKPQYDIDSRQQIDKFHPLAVHLCDNPQLLASLAQIAADPFKVNFEALPGVERVSHETEDSQMGTPGRIKVYFRVLKATVADHRARFEKYLSAYPAALVRVLPFLAATTNMDPTAEIQIIYSGITEATTSEGRGDEDEKGSWTHFTNFCKVNRLGAQDFTYFELALAGPAWQLENDSVHELRAHELASAVEELAIATLGPARLNSAPGGLTSNWRPGAAIVSLLDKVNETLAQVTSNLEPFLPSKQRKSRVDATTSLEDVRRHDFKKIDRHVDDCAETWNTPSLKSGAKLTPMAVDEIKKNAKGLEYAVDGYPVSVRTLKDVTRAEFKVEETGSTFLGPLAGHGPRIHRETLEFVRSHVQDSSHSIDCDRVRSANETDACASDDHASVRQLGASSVDFWVILVHKLVILAIIFWMRFVCCVVAAPVLVVTSAKLAALVHLGLIDTLVPWQNLAGLAGDVLRRCIRHFDSGSLISSDHCKGEVNWHDLPLDGFLSFIGATVVFRFVFQWRLVIYQLHFGAVKYDPLLAGLYRRLLCLSETMIRVAQVLGAALKPEFDKDSREALQRAIEHICTESGLEDELVATRGRAIELNNALQSLRLVGARDSQLDADADQLVETYGMTKKDALEEVRARRFERESAQMSSIIQRSVTATET
ncbi:hypothetical protein ACM66B_004651 [Microbotryomycetes sp. NB124-2]